MQLSPERFRSQAQAALRDPTLQQALSRARSGFIDKRRKGIHDIADFEALRERGRRIRDLALSQLDHHLEQLESAVRAAGGQVHWAENDAQAREIILGLCRQADAQRVTKSKSMVGEEIAINPALEAAGLDVVETDLGEYIIQLAQEPPSHIIAPAVHKTRQQISELFDTHHHQGALKARLREIPELVNEAREVLRDKFLSADVGITGANFLVAETGSIVLVTNEGNADLTHTLPRMHIAVAGIDKVVPTLDDATTLLRLLGRSATGQAMSCYTTFVTGPRRADDPDGPGEFHLVLLDNGRSRMLAGPYREMLRCIRCGACMNHCPVYSAIGGHAYGWVYPGPMGSVLTPLFRGLENTRDLPNACTLNGRCASVCPVKIPLPDLLRQLRAEQFRRNITDSRTRWGLRLWGALARRPALYALSTGLAGRLLRLLGGKRGRIRRLPLAGGWTASRDFPAPQGPGFRQQWKKRQTERKPV
ncbi:MAG: iron-sulfur cluster-binding protein [Ectothiorhodospiraceae bacterium]|nr:iron-sulfur cluster-binding protein [Ectothiorhodospiraceae bacterium]